MTSGYHTTPDDDFHAVLHAALTYARRGWPVFPCHTPQGPRCSCGNPQCDTIGKHPRTRQGLKDATADEALLRRWWSQWTKANITGVIEAVCAVSLAPIASTPEQVRTTHGWSVARVALEAQPRAWPAFGEV